MEKTYIFCELLNERIKQVEIDCSPLIKIAVGSIRQSYNSQQHIVQVQCEIHVARAKCSNLLRSFINQTIVDSFHNVGQCKKLGRSCADNFHIRHFYWPYKVAGIKSHLDGSWDENWLRDMESGFSRRVWNMIKLDLIKDKSTN